MPTIEEPTPDVPVDPTPDKPTPENEVMMSEDYPYICEVIGEGYIVYSNDDENPYNVDLDKYGYDIRAIFYEPDFSDYSDPYVNVEKSSFYNDYDNVSSSFIATCGIPSSIKSGEVAVKPSFS